MTEIKLTAHQIHTLNIYVTGNVDDSIIDDNSFGRHRPVCKVSAIRMYNVGYGDMIFIWPSSAVYVVYYGFAGTSSLSSSLKDRMAVTFVRGHSVELKRTKRIYVLSAVKRDGSIACS